MHTPASLDDQLAPDHVGDKGCLQCHAEFAPTEAIAAHTHHPAESAGSECLNCHMPHTTYGLMKAIRSHLIDSPTVRATLETGRPNACNLCHLDQTLAWAGEHLSRWYGQPPLSPDELTHDQQHVSAAVLDVLTGDANQRALAAWHFGWPPAQEASGVDWMGPYLGHLIADPYACVRYIAGRSLQTLPKFSDFSFDYVGDSSSISRARDQAIARWMRNRSARLDRSGEALLISADGSLDAPALSRLSNQRDDRVIDLRE